MDSVTQGVLGAAIGHASLGSKIGKKAVITGIVIATIPDLDVLLYLVYDKFDMLSIHRGLSHSILFNLFVSVVLTTLLKKTKYFKKVRISRLFAFVSLCLLTHILLDSFTTYGTQLFLPFSDKRVGFNSINVVDPFYTVPLLIGLFMTLWKPNNREMHLSYNTIGLIFSTCYLLFTLFNKQRVVNEFKESLLQNQISYTDILTSPVGTGNIHWYGVAKSEDSLYMKKLSSLNGAENSFERFPINEKYLNEIDSEMANKMRWFSNGFYMIEKEKDTILVFNLQVDMRGSVMMENTNVPTVGYFKFINYQDTTKFSSGSVSN